MTEHTVKSYEEELRELARLVTEMGGLAASEIRDAINALAKHENALAARVVEADEAVDELQRRIEGMAIHMIAKRQPLASDLREVVAALHICIDLERIGDFAKNIAKRVGVLGDNSYPKHLVRRVQRMAHLALAQMNKVLDSYAQQDLAKAIEVWNQDEEIDSIYTSLFRELLTYMMEEPRNITFSTHLLFCAKNIERIGDHATNIAETVYYMIKGEPLQESRPKEDETSIAVE